MLSVIRMKISFSRSLEIGESSEMGRKELLSIGRFVGFQ